MTSRNTSSISYKRLFAEGAAIVISILLAFAIDAWWGNRLDESEEHRLLIAVGSELEENLVQFDRSLLYRKAILDTIGKLFEASAGNLKLSSSELDILLGDLCWWDESQYSVGALKSILEGGKLSLIQNENLRQQLASLPDFYARLSRMENQEYLTQREFLIPYFFKHAHLPQISNTIIDKPGVGDNLNPDSVYSATNKQRDHAELLKEDEFLGILTQKQWDQIDVIWVFGEIRKEIEQTISLIEQEI